MVRSELLRKLAAERPDLPLNTIETVVDTIFGAITDALARGSRVEIRGFGVFDAKARQARTGHNPRTGEAVAIAGKNVPKFRAGKVILGRLNGNAGWLCCTNPVRDSCRESSVVAGPHEQTDITFLQDDELG